MRQSRRIQIKHYRRYRIIVLVIVLRSKVHLWTATSWVQITQYPGISMTTFVVNTLNTVLHFKQVMAWAGINTSGHSNIPAIIVRKSMK